MKKPRTVALPTDVPGYPPSANGCQQEPGPSPALATSKGKSHILWVVPCLEILLAGTDIPRTIPFRGWVPFGPMR